MTEIYLQCCRTGPGICAGLSFGTCQTGGNVRSGRAADVGERACCHLRDETARNKRRKKDKGTYVVVRRYKLASPFWESRRHWCSHAILSGKWRANGWMHGVVCCDSKFHILEGAGLAPPAIAVCSPLIHSTQRRFCALRRAWADNEVFSNAWD